MRYSLFSRFQGAFCGSVLGESLGFGCLEKSGYALEQVIRQFPYQLSPVPSWGWHDYAIASTHHLLQFDRDSDFQPGASSPEAMGAIVPIACFYHENRLLLRQQLASIAQTYAFKPEETLNALVLSEILGLILREQLEPLNVLPKLIEQLATEQDNLETAQLLPQLDRIQTWVEQGATLEAVTSQLTHQSVNSLSMLRALYCFFSTPEDFRLVVLRAARTSKRPQLTCAIAGMLAGAYNSFEGIPIPWRLSWERLSNAQHPNNRTPPNLHELSQLSDHLLAAWSGFYHAGMPALQLKGDCAICPSNPMSTVAAPQTLRPR